MECGKHFIYGDAFYIIIPRETTIAIGKRAVVCQDTELKGEIHIGKTPLKSCCSVYEKFHDKKNLNSSIYSFFFLLFQGAGNLEVFITLKIPEFPSLN